MRIYVHHGFRQRQFDEAINIEDNPKENSLNSKKEYFKHEVKRLGLNKYDMKEQCNYCGRMFKSILEMEDHEKDIHIAYKCDVLKCEYQSIGKKDLKYHKIAAHKITQ